MLVEDFVEVLASNKTGKGKRDGCWNEEQERKILLPWRGHHEGVLRAFQIMAHWSSAHPPSFCWHGWGESVMWRWVDLMRFHSRCWSGEKQSDQEGYVLCQAELVSWPEDMRSHSVVPNKDVTSLALQLGEITLTELKVSSNTYHLSFQRPWKVTHWLFSHLPPVDWNNIFALLKEYISLGLSWMMDYR